MGDRMKGVAIVLTAIALATLPGLQAAAQLLDSWGPVQRIEFSRDELPQNLYSAFTNDEKNSVLQYCLPAGYSPSKSYPLIVYVPGFHGHPGGNIRNAKDIGAGRDCVVASLPLFKTGIDPTEIADGLLIGFSDAPVLGAAYRTMLERLYREVPNLDPDRSGLAGFSNGAQAIAVLVSSHDEFILEHFHSYCLVDHGMFHLADLHKNPTRDRRFLLLVGEKGGPAQELKQRAARLVEDSYGLLGIDLEWRILKDTGHELTERCKRDIGDWILP